MESRNSQLVHRFLTASGERDIEGAVQLTGHDIEFRPVTEPGQTFRGHEGVRRFLAQVAERGLSERPVAERYEDYGNLVVATGYVRAVSTSAGEVRTPASWVFVLEDGLIARIEGFFTRRQALLALGLDPFAATRDERV